LRYLNLNDNNLTGPIPNSLVKLPNLEVLDVSNNNLSGIIPTFAPSVKLITSGNDLLIPSRTGNTSDFPPEGQKRGIIAGIVVGTIVGVIFCIFIGRRITTTTEKSDVFSFGVLTLEIVSGRRNSSFQDDEHSPSLLGYGWKLWSEGNILELIDPVISSDPSCHRKMLRCFHVGLLCVQNFVKDRPTMMVVDSMLSSEIENLPTPKQPPFFDERIMMDHSQLQASQ
ncbi:hypothetical protein Goari_004708, partial [Gossypium aridum]|nr:hypothetical protein [Gossypium aridum]